MSGLLHDFHSSSLSDTKRYRELKSSSGSRAFGSGVIRFRVTDFDPNPGVGNYEISSPNPLLKRSPSLSSKGYGICKSPKQPIFPDKGIPGPAHYNVKSISLLSPDKTKYRSSFIKSGDGRVPFPKPSPIPGPLSYWVNPDPGRSPFLMKKKSAAFCSKSKSASLFDGRSESPPAGLYNIESDLLTSKNNFEWSRSSHVRFQDIGKDNNVPGPQRYFNPELDAQLQPRSMRTVGRYKGKQIGKQFEKAKTALHTFGANKDRFKDSVYGRLDLKAEIPGPCSYEVHTTSIRPSTSPEAPGVARNTFGADKERFKDSIYGRLDLKAQIPGPGAYGDSIVLSSPTNSRASPKAGSRPATSGGYDPRLMKHKIVSPKALYSPPRSPTSNRNRGGAFPSPRSYSYDEEDE